VLNNSKLSYNSFIKLLKIYKLNKLQYKLKYFKNKKIAFIGTSPITLIAANIYALFGAKIIIFEKNNIGGAWANIKVNKYNFPISTHILMPNKFLFDLLNLMNVKSSLWSKKPIIRDSDYTKIKNFPSNDLKYDKFNMPDFSFDRYSIPERLIKNLNHEKIKLIRKNIISFTEKDDCVILNDGKKLYKYEYLFITPAAQFKKIKLKILSIDIQYSNYLNNSLLLVTKCDLKIGSTFTHFKNKFFIKEIQTFKDTYKNNIIILKLSQNYNLNKNNLNKILNFLKKKYPKINLENSNIEKLKYPMKRMSANMQKKIMHYSERVIVPIYKYIKNDAELNSVSQDLARLVNEKNFIQSLVGSIE